MVLVVVVRVSDAPPLIFTNDSFFCTGSNGEGLQWTGCGSAKGLVYNTLWYPGKGLSVSLHCSLAQLTQVDCCTSVDGAQAELQHPHLQG